MLRPTPTANATTFHNRIAGMAAGLTEGQYAPYRPSCSLHSGSPGLRGTRRPHPERDQSVCRGNQPTTHATVADWSVEKAAPEWTRAANAAGAHADWRRPLSGLWQ